MPAQLRLSLERGPDHAPSTFVVSDSNALAVRTLESWPDWRGGALALVGPPGSGKSHLAAIWRRRVGAACLDAGDADIQHHTGPLLIEDADAEAPEEMLFHLLNQASRPGGGLLLTSRQSPGRWTASLPDLRSRLNALPVAQLEEPDDTVLSAMLDKFFRERNIRAGEDVLGYLVRRIERSAESAMDVVARLDEAAYAQGRELSRNFASKVLGDVRAAPDAVD